MKISYVSAVQVRDWVWIGRSTLERNAVDLTCPKRLMSDADFNSNLCRRPPSSSQLLQPGGSNRNSTVSTYRGSECSVRITANPLAVADDNGNMLNEDEEVPIETTSSHAARDEPKSNVDCGSDRKKGGL